MTASTQSMLSTVTGSSLPKTTRSPRCRRHPGLEFRKKIGERERQRRDVDQVDIVNDCRLFLAEVCDQFCQPLKAFGLDDARDDGLAEFKTVDFLAGLAGEDIDQILSDKTASRFVWRTFGLRSVKADRWASLPSAALMVTGTCRGTSIFVSNAVMRASLEQLTAPELTVAKFFTTQPRA